MDRIWRPVAGRRIWLMVTVFLRLPTPGVCDEYCAYETNIVRVLRCVVIRSCATMTTWKVKGNSKSFPRWKIVVEEKGVFRRLSFCGIQRRNVRLVRGWIFEVGSCEHFWVSKWKNDESLCEHFLFFCFNCA